MYFKMSHLSRLVAGALILAAPIIADVSNLINETSSFDAGSYGGFPNQTFRSTSVVGPILEISTWDQDATDAAPYILITGTYGGGNGPVLLRSDDLSLVYSHTVYNESLDANVQRFNGTDYLTVWSGALVENNYQGYVQMYDSNYDLKYNFTTQNFNQTADMHEFLITDEGTALMTLYQTIYPYDLSFIEDGRVDDNLTDSCFQEINIASQEVVFTWCLRDHWAVNDTYVTIQNYGRRDGGGGFDYGHINSIEKTPDGNYLVSFRHLCSVLLIDGKSSDIIWHLGGKHNNFTDISDGQATKFSFQHDARFVNEDRTELKLFNNDEMFVSGVNESLSDASSVKHLRLDYTDMTVELIHEYFHPDRIVAQAMGGQQTLPDSGNTLIAWGFQPSITEHTLEGDVVLDIQSGPYDWINNAPQIYRAKKVSWTGSPSWGPSIAGSNSSDKERGVYLSWNGATEYTQWAVLSSDDPSALDGASNVVGPFRQRAGFETFASLAKEVSDRYVRAAALDSAGRILGSTDVVDMQTGEVKTSDRGGGVTEVGDGSNSEDDAEGAASVSRQRTSVGVIIGMVGVGIFLGW